MVNYLLSIFNYQLPQADALGRFRSIAPLWEKQYQRSPYVYCDNNPVNRFDDNGYLEVNSKDDPRNFNTGVDKVIFKTEKGTEINALYNKSGYGNCAGYAMTGYFDINMHTTDADKIIKDEYKRISEDKVKIDDKVVYKAKSDGEYLGKSYKKGASVHFATVQEVIRDKNGKVIGIKVIQVDGSGSHQNAEIINYKEGNDDDTNTESIFYRKNGRNKQPVMHLKHKTDVLRYYPE